MPERALQMAGVGGVPTLACQGRTDMRERWIVGGLLVLLACTGPGGVSRREVERDSLEGRVEEGAKKLERARDAEPGSLDTRIYLAHAYYLLAREAPDALRLDVRRLRVRQRMAVLQLHAPGPRIELFRTVQRDGGNVFAHIVQNFLIVHGDSPPSSIDRATR